MEYNKLVRDGIPEKLDNLGVPYEKRIASEEEYRFELIKKLKEETSEFEEVGDIEELADILEVIDALKKLPEYVNVLEVQKQKREERGGFENRLILKGQKD
jgi:predicted house-cleaning noncanonical NTP pyrophosphatase (MazG superfamily)